MARPEIEDFVSYSLSSVDGIGTYDELAKYSKAQDEFIDHQATEITSLKEQLKELEEENKKMKEAFVKIETLTNFGIAFAENSKNLDPEFIKAVNESFNKLISK